MLRGCLTLLIGFALGAALMLALWPHPPAGVSAPRTSDVRVVVSDASIARTVQRRVSTMQVPSVDHVRVASHPPKSLIVHVDLSLGPLSAPATLEVMPVAQNGRVQARLISSEVAGVPVPPQLTGFVGDAINRRVGDLQGNGGRVTGTRVLPSGLEVFTDVP